MCYLHYRLIRKIVFLIVAIVTKYLEIKFQQQKKVIT